MAAEAHEATVPSLPVIGGNKKNVLHVKFLHASTELLAIRRRSTVRDEKKRNAVSCKN